MSTKKSPAPKRGISIPTLQEGSATIDEVLDSLQTFQDAQNDTALEILSALREIKESLTKIQIALRG